MTWANVAEAEGALQVQMPLQDPINTVRPGSLAALQVSLQAPTHTLRAVTAEFETTRPQECPFLALCSPLKLLLNAGGPFLVERSAGTKEETNIPLFPKLEDSADSALSPSHAKLHCFLKDALLRFIDAHRYPDLASQPAISLLVQLSLPSSRNV